MRRRASCSSATRTASPAKGHVLFETGYGPSGLPHIGTFNEVLRTTMVRRAFETMLGYPDAADRVQRRHGRAAQGARQRAQPADARRISRQAADQGARSVRLPRELRRAQQCAAARNSSTGSASTMSSSRRPTAIPVGRFDETLKSVLRHYQAIMDVMLPTLGAERRATYSPVLPVSPKSGDRAAGAGRGGRRRGRADRVRG